MATKSTTNNEFTKSEIIKLAQADPKLAETVYSRQLASNAQKAFAKFQANLRPVPENGHVDHWSKRKNRYVPMYRYVYFKDLKSTINDAMKGTGLIWRQVPDNCTTAHIPVLDKYGNPTGKMSIGEVVGIKTIIMYKNGYPFKSGYMRTVASSTSPQDVGSAMTYCRRYSLSIAVGITSTPDTDGRQTSNNGFSGSFNSQSRRPKTISKDQENTLKTLSEQVAKQYKQPTSKITAYITSMDGNGSSLSSILADKFTNAKKYLESHLKTA